jgi:hypothetical protein
MIPNRFGPLRRLTAYALAGGLTLSATTAEAACLHTNQLWSCTNASGVPLELFCFGAGVVMTCMEFSGEWILVSPHEVLSQISDIDSQVSSALLASSASRNSTIESEAPQLNIGGGGTHITVKSPGNLLVPPAGEHSGQQ